MNDSFMYSLGALESLTTNSEKTISTVDYEIFCEEFIFDKLKGKTFGEAFCERFGFNNFFLKALSDSTAKLHIEKLGYIK
jgi:hypothetical protein